MVRPDEIRLKIDHFSTHYSGSHLIFSSFIISSLCKNILILAFSEHFQVDQIESGNVKIKCRLKRQLRKWTFSLKWMVIGCVIFITIVMLLSGGTGAFLTLLLNRQSEQQVTTTFNNRTTTGTAAPTTTNNNIAKTTTTTTSKLQCS